MRQQSRPEQVARFNVRPFRLTPPAGAEDRRKRAFARTFIDVSTCVIVRPSPLASARIHQRDRAQGTTNLPSGIHPALRASASTRLRSQIQRPSTYWQISARRTGRGASMSHRPVVEPMPQRLEIAALKHHEHDIAVISGDRE